ncbi:MAG TPA: TonB-dependent receptor [Steroidobacteraceae bacterium]|nr:TonB-dependent receptor [Steroidobacteraceae bacterium]
MLGFLSGASAFAQEAAQGAQTTQTAQGSQGAQAPEGAALNEVVVTGTRIRGVAPVGSTVVELSTEDLQKTGLTSVADALNTVPFVLKEGAGEDYSGGQGSSSSLNGLAFNKSPNLRGLGVGATLSLVNGHRVPYEGANMNAFDGDNIPQQALKRVDIVADGTSPIYGADAIAGTVNYILRDPFTGLDTDLQYGHTDGQNSWQATLVGGLKWSNDGGLIVSYQHTHFDPLLASSRPDLYNDDFTPFGGPASPAYSSPGNVIVNGVAYAIPHGQNGQTLTLAQLGPAGVANTQNAWVGYDALPGFGRDIATLNFTQRFTDWFELFGDGFYSKRNYAMALISNGTATTVTIPNTNFYSPCNRSLTGAAAELVAACNTGSLTVDYNTVFDAGAAGRVGNSTSWDGAVGGRFTLPAGWSATLEASRGTHDESSNNGYFFGNGLPSSPALGGTTAETAYNVFCDGTAFTCNPPALTAGIPGANWGIESEFDLRQYTLNLDGPVFRLPGGSVRIAVGAERTDGTFTNTNNFGSTKGQRTDNAGYGELYIPIVGDANAIPGIKKLQIDVAGRIDSYNDVGNTTNPKVGINWSPVTGLQFHGSYGTSFRAPSLVDNDPFAQHGYLVPAFPGNSILPSLCPTCAAAGTLSAYQALGGANGDLTPETSTSYSLGFDWAPPAVRGLDVGANYWWVNYTSQVNYPVYNAGGFGAINQQYYNNYIIYNPMYFPTLAPNNPVAFFGNFPTVDLTNPNCSSVYGHKVTTQAQFNTLLTCINQGGDGGLFGPPSSPAGIAAIENGHRINSGVTKADGIDLNALYTWDTSVGTFRASANGELILKWEVAPISTAPVTDQVNEFTYPLRFRGRGEFSWNKRGDYGEVGANLFVNYDNAYHIDPIFLPGGVSSAYTSIASYTTFDMTLTYDTGADMQSKLARNFRVMFSVQNLFDKDPPLVLNSTSVGSIRFDNLVASPIGRMLQIQLGKRW